MDISKLKLTHDFSLMTEALGTIRCGSLNLINLSKLQKATKSPEANGFEFARRLLGEVANKISLVEKGEAEKSQVDRFTDAEISQVSEKELELFALAPEKPMVPESNCFSLRLV